MEIYRYILKTRDDKIWPLLVPARDNIGARAWVSNYIPYVYAVWLFIHAPKPNAGKSLCKRCLARCPVTLMWKVTKNNNIWSPRGSVPSHSNVVPKSENTRYWLWFLTIFFFFLNFHINYSDHYKYCHCYNVAFQDDKDVCVGLKDHLLICC